MSRSSFNKVVPALVLAALTAAVIGAGPPLFAEDALHAPSAGWSVTVAPGGAVSGGRTFRVVLVCGTDEERARGLQGFPKLAKDEAALFLFERTEPVSFWMGSVSYPIDIVFVGPAGRVVRVFPGCRPGSREVYDSGEPVARAIETAAGSGIRAGDRVVISEGKAGRSQAR